jgi:hypothetical protein
MAENPPTPTIPTTSTPRQTNRTPVASAPSGPDFDAIAVTMQRTREAQDTGTYEQHLAEVAPQAEPEQLPEMDLADIQTVYAVSGIPAALRPAAMADVPLPPGLGERDWSTEVVARHPELMAATMAELAALDDVSPLGTDPVDPTDAQALTVALNQLGSVEAVKSNLRNRAAELNGERITARAPSWRRRRSREGSPPGSS